MRQQERICDTIDKIDNYLEYEKDQERRERLGDEKTKLLWQLVKLGLMPSVEARELNELEQLENQLENERKQINSELSTTRQKIKQLKYDLEVKEIEVQKGLENQRFHKAQQKVLEELNRS